VNSRFSGKVTLSNLNPPESYTISGEGSGGAAGFAKGGADVKLEEIDQQQTKLSYKVDAQVGGKLAQLGQRLIQSTANKYAQQFFDKFEEVVGAGHAEATGSAAAATTSAETGSRDESPAAHAAAEAAGTYPETPGESASTAKADQQAKQEASAQQGKSKDVGTRDDRMIVPYPVWVGGLIVVVIVLLAIFAL
jgi:cobalamin biosynthesis Mg chelatase CobN